MPDEEIPATPPYFTKGDLPPASNSFSSPPHIDDGLLREFGTPEQLGALYGAMAAAAGEFKAVEKTADVNFNNVRYSYAPLANLVNAVRGALGKQGLICTQPFTMEDGAGVITTIVAHKEGGRLVSKVKFRANADIKTLGGQTTYLGRYALCRVFMLDGVDDADQFEEKTPSGAGGDDKPRRPRNQAPRPGKSDSPPAAAKKPPAARRQPPPQVDEDGPPPPSDEDAPGGSTQDLDDVPTPPGATGVPMDRAMSEKLRAAAGSARISRKALNQKCVEMTGSPPAKDMDAGHAAAMLAYLETIKDGAGESL